MYYMIYNKRYESIEALSDNKIMMQRYIVSHITDCENIVVRELKKKQFDKLMTSYEELYVCDYNGLPVLNKYVKLIEDIIGNYEVLLLESYIGLIKLSTLDIFDQSEKKKIKKIIKLIQKKIDMKDLYNDNECLPSNDLLNEILDLEKQFRNKIDT